MTYNYILIFFKNTDKVYSLQYLTGKEEYTNFI